MNMMSVSVLNFEEKWEKTKSYIQLFSNGKVNLPSSSKIGDINFKSKKCDMNFYNDGKRRHLVVKFKNLANKKDFDCDMYLDETINDSMVIATPFKKDKHFYYNQKINCLKASGYFKFGEEIYSMDDCFGVLDWGRGVWTYKNTWYWSSLSSLHNGKKIGFNLGYGFGDTRNATENMIFYDGKAYKVEQVTFHIPQTEDGKDDYLKEWKFTSSDNKINLTFKPIFDRYDNANVIIIKSLQHQVFGKFSGTIRVDEEVIEIKDLVGNSIIVPMDAICHNKWNPTIAMMSKTYKSV